jgi:hypothetical protein
MKPNETSNEQERRRPSKRSASDHDNSDDDSNASKIPRVDTPGVTLTAVSALPQSNDVVAETLTSTTTIAASTTCSSTATSTGVEITMLTLTRDQSMLTLAKSTTTAVDDTRLDDNTVTATTADKPTRGNVLRMRPGAARQVRI